jgi:hypothetical protein
MVFVPGGHAMEDERPVDRSSGNAKKYHQLQDMMVRRLRSDLGDPAVPGPVVAHWSIRRPEPLASVSVVVPPVLAQPPSVWIFDPSDPADSIHGEVLTESQDVDRVAAFVKNKIRWRPARRV